MNQPETNSNSGNLDPVFRRLDARNFGGHSMWTEDWLLSAQNLGSFVQRGAYSLTGGNTSAYFARPYISANNAPNLAILLTSRTTNQAFVQTIISATTLGLLTISAVSGFTISGSGTDNGYWMAIGYK